ncbi:MFS transporter [Streptomyces sp. SID3343]|nr:MFS transporter [Streptomyces sp. SID3343]
MLAVLLSAWFLAQFDFFVVNVAAPSFERRLHAGPVALELIVGGYAFAYATGMITGGRLGDRFGYRRVFVVGMLAFTGASLLCGLAADPGQLVAARLLQGLAGAVMVPQVLALITTTFPASTRGRALGWYGVAGGLGSIAGQVCGGLLLDVGILGLGWRVIFLINVPIGIVAALLAARLLPPSRPGPRRTQDAVGAASIALVLALILVPVMLGRDAGWPVWTWICLFASPLVAIPAVRRQRALAARGADPILDPTLFAKRSYLAGIAAVTAFMAYFASFMFTLTLLLQGGLGLGALGAGLVFAPMGVLFSVTAAVGSRLVDRFGLAVVVFGGVLIDLGLGVGVLALHFAGADVPLAWIVVAVTAVGAGNGLVLPRLIGAALVDVAPTKAGIGSAVLSTAQQFAGSAGVAVVGAVFFAAVGSRPHAAAYVGAMQRSMLIDIALVTVVVVLVHRLGRASHRARSK